MYRDGTTSTVLFVGELLKKSERYLEEGLHPRLITEVIINIPIPSFYCLIFY